MKKSMFYDYLPVHMYKVWDDYANFFCADASITVVIACVRKLYPLNKWFNCFWSQSGSVIHCGTTRMSIHVLVKSNHHPTFLVIAHTHDPNSVRQYVCFLQGLSKEFLTSNIVTQYNTIITYMLNVQSIISYCHWCMLAANISQIFVLKYPRSHLFRIHLWKVQVLASLYDPDHVAMVYKHTIRGYDGFSGECVI